MVADFPLDFSVPASVLERAKGIKLVLFDVDGVLTDGRLILDNNGQEYKAFNTLDGHGIKMLQRYGIETGIITGRTSQLVARRAQELGMAHLHQGAHEKRPVYESLIKKLGLSPAQIAFAGDDVVDMPIMLRVGLAVAVQDAHSLVRKHAHWVTPKCGGRGAVRDLCDMILTAQGHYATEMQRYL